MLNSRERICAPAAGVKLYYGRMLMTSVNKRLHHIFDSSDSDEQVLSRERVCNDTGANPRVEIH